MSMLRLWQRQYHLRNVPNAVCLRKAGATLEHSLTIFVTFCHQLQGTGNADEKIMMIIFFRLRSYL
jgi:hypothetical protein